MSVVANVAINIDGKQAESLLKSLQTEVERLNGTFKKIEQPAKSFGAKIKEAAGSALGQLTAITGAAFTLQKAFNTLADQSRAEAALQSLGVNSEIASAQFAELSRELRGQASSVELTAAAYDVASAGFVEVSQQAQILEASTKGAVGGMSELNTVGNAVTSVLNAYGMSADQAGSLVDGFIQTQNDGKIVLAEYATQIGRLAPTASAAGVGIDELNAAISTITAQGVPVEATFTGLNQALVSILKPTKEAQDLAKSLGIEFNETALRTKGFGGLLSEVAEATGGSTSQLTSLFGSVDALKSILPLVNDNLQKFDKNLNNQKKSAGVAEKAFKDMSSTLEGAVKELQSAFVGLIAAFKPVTPAIIAPFKILADTINLVSKNIKTLALTAAFFGTFVGVLKAAAIATKLWAVATAGLATAKKAAGVAAAFLQGVMNPASIAQIGIALGVATGAAVALGAAMGDAGTKAAESKDQQGQVADETAKINEEIKKQIEGLDKIPPKQNKQVQAAESALSKIKEQTMAIDAQIASLERGASVTSARYQAEAAMNELQGKQLEFDYERATTAERRLQIAIQMFKQQVQAAEIEYKQALENIALEQRKAELQQKAAMSKYKEIEAEGRLQILKAESAEEELKRKNMLDEALGAQNSVIQSTKENITAQAQIGKYQQQTAAAQLKNKTLTAEMALKQKLATDEIGLTNQRAHDLSRSIANNVGQARNLATAMSGVAGQTERAASAMYNLARARSASAGSSTATIPAFANGGVVTRPTLALIGEANEKEYIVPESKAASFATNYLSATRSQASGNRGDGRPTKITINTGPVIQQDGQNYVSLSDLEGALEDFADMMIGNGRSAGGRRYAGVG